MQFEDQPPRDHESIARGDDAPARWRLAVREDLSPHIIELLANDPSHDVRTSVAMNCSIPTSVLAALAEKYPELIPVIAGNPHGPAALKKPVPILEHISSSIAQFMDDEAATMEERQALAKEINRLSRQQLRRHRKGELVDPSASPPLAQVWATIRPGQAQ